MAKRVSSLGHRHTANDLTPFLEGSATISGAWTFTGLTTFSQDVLLDTTSYLSVQGAAADQGQVGQIAFVDISSGVGRFGSYNWDTAAYTAVQVVGSTVEIESVTGDITLDGNTTINPGSGNTTLTLESSTGDCALYIKADTDNNNENENPFIRFEQDGNAVQLVIGTTGDANLDAQGNTFTNCSQNAAAIHALYTSGTLALGVGNSVGLKFASNNAATFYANVTIDTDGAGPMLDLGDGANADGDTFLRLNLDRTWSFKQSGTGAATALRLQTGTDNKLFHITDSGGTDRVSFNVSTTQNLNSARMPVLALVDGITAPSALAGHAVLYVDTSDGDLKVRFADGTTKTIATDT